MTFWVAGAAVVSAGIGAAASNSASNKMKGAADGATALQGQMYDETVQRNQPFVQGGTTAFNALMGRFGLAGADGSAASGYGSLGHVPTAEEVMAQPGYQFGLDQGQNTLNRQLNARGMSYSGEQLKRATMFGNDYGTGQYNNAFNNLLRGNDQVYNQLMGASQLGQQSANNTSTYGSQFGQQAGENAMFRAAAQGSNALAQGNIWGSLANQGGSMYKSWSANQKTPSSSIWSPGYDDRNATSGGWTGDH